MHTTNAAPILPSNTSLVDRLMAFDAFRELPRPEIEWLVSHGEYRVYPTGTVILTSADESQEMIAQLSGRIVVYFGHGGGQRHVAESKEGSLTGLLPFSRLKRPPNDVVVEDTAEVVAVNKREFPAMIRECPALIENLVHNMLDRARRFAAADWQDDKVLALGRLASGLAHELNNPASAASSGASRLVNALREIGHAAHAVGMAALSANQRAQVLDVVSQCQSPERVVAHAPLERADLEEQCADWLAQHNAPEEWAPLLVDGAVPRETLHALAASLPPAALLPALQWIGLSASAALLAADVERATHRIHDVVAAVRDFSHMDRAAVRSAVDVARSLTDTVGIMRTRANSKDVLLTLEIEPGLPSVSAVAPDLNQVWSHLIDNALDATPPGGEVTVTARRDGDKVLVCVTDSGTGIPEKIQPRIFDPFFTTKKVGEGTGLGLDIVRRTVRYYHGEVEFESKPGRTVFRVLLPAMV